MDSTLDYENEALPGGMVAPSFSPPRQPKGSGWKARPIDPEILRSSDIRGIVGENLTCETAYTVGRAFGTVVRAMSGNTVCVGRDGRLSSPSLEAALMEGLVDSGISVLRIGVGPSPMLYFAVHHLKAHGGIIVTGSHNPSEYNGFKMMLGTASFHGRDIQRLGEIAKSREFINGAGEIIEIDINHAYADKLSQGLECPSEMRVAWDPGNGAAADVLKKLIKKLPGHHVVINDEIDGRFPAHHPDPTVPENLEQLHALVAREACDLGIAFDGDGDRIGVVDNDRTIVWGDQLLMLLAEPVLAAQPGATIIADVKASNTLFDRVGELGGTPLMWKTGHSLIKSKMHETGAPLAGEMSGHIFFADRYYGFDDALYAAVRLLDVLGQSNESLTDLLKKLPTAVNTPELRFDCPESAKRGVIQNITSALMNDRADVDFTDGVRVTTRDGWWLLRPSNTQAVLVARCEARDERGLYRVKQELAFYLEAAGRDTTILEGTCHV